MAHQSASLIRILTHIALKFWKLGKLTQTKRASAMNGLLANFDQNHEIYTDTTDMAIFFD